MIQKSRLLFFRGVLGVKNFREIPKFCAEWKLVCGQLVQLLCPAGSRGLWPPKCAFYAPNPPSLC